MVPTASPLHSEVATDTSCARQAAKLAGMSRCGSTRSYSSDAVWVKRPDWRPRLVITWITPADASAPYSVAAAGPFTISMDSMSAGFRLLSALVMAPDAADTCLLSTRTPSMYSSGSFDSEMDEAPRMRICCAVPATPDPPVRETPGTRPCSTSDTLFTGAAAITSPTGTLAMVAPCARRSCLPAVPVTTSSFSFSPVTASAKLAVAVCPAATVTRWVPGA